MIRVGGMRREVERIEMEMASGGRLDLFVGMREWRCRGDEGGANHPSVAEEAGVETRGAQVLEMTGGRPQHCWMAFVLALAGSWIGNE